MEKMLVTITSIFFFPYNVFRSFPDQFRVVKTPDCEVQSLSILLVQEWPKIKQEDHDGPISLT